MGAPETAHRVVNDSAAELAYPSVSTMMPAGVGEYPDSTMIGASGHVLRHMTRIADGADYRESDVHAASISCLVFGE
jgi:uncharacterized cupin superfamily protein